jgi:Flp pilus assembly protein TadD
VQRAVLISALAAGGCTHSQSPPVGNMDVADTALANGAPALALNVAQAALASRPDDVDALLREGRAYVLLNRTEEARQAYTQALTLAPNSKVALMELGRLTLFSDPAAAATRFAQVLEHEPHDAAALTDLGVALDMQNQHAAAQENYRKAIMADPAMVSAQVNLGMSMAMAGDNTGALRTLRPLAASNAATPRIRQDLALVLARAGYEAEAAKALRTDMSADAATAAVAHYRSLGGGSTTELAPPR